LRILNEYPPYLKIGEQYGARFIQVPSNQDKFAFAEQYALFLKPGFDYPEVIQKIGEYANQIREWYGRRSDPEH